MALLDATNIPRAYVPSVVLDSKYAPVFKRGCRIMEGQDPRTCFPIKRKAGDTNIDLWLDGSIYPTNPSTGMPPPFRTLKAFLEFVCHGEAGLLGYVEKLAGPNGYSTNFVRLLQQKVLEQNVCTNTEIGRLQHFVGHLLSELEVVKKGWATQVVELQQVRTDEMNSSQLHSERLREQCRTLQRDLERNLAQYNQALSVYECQAREATHAHAQALEDGKRESAERLAMLSQEHLHVLNTLTCELTGAKNELVRLQQKLHKMVMTPLGTRSQLRPSRSLDQLAQKGGQRRARISAIRRLLQPNTHHQLVDGNKGSGSRKRLCGPKSTQEGTTTALAGMLSRDEALALGSTSKLSFVGRRMANHYLEKIAAEIDTESILAACDMTGVSQRGYGQIYKTIKGRVGIVDKDLKANFLPTPNKVCSSHCLLCNLQLFSAPNCVVLTGPSIMYV